MQKGNNGRRFSVINEMITRLGMMMILFLMAVALRAQVQEGFAVEPDTIPEVPYQVVEKKKAKLFAGKPGKAALYGLIPGAGQIYNRDYYKLPFVYGAIGGMVYLTQSNSKRYKEFRDAYISRVDANANGETPTDQFAGPDCQTNCADPPEFIPTAEGIRGWRDRYNKWRQQSIFGLGAVYLLTVIEAFVAAHLQDFDVSDDLSMDLRPRIYTDQTTLAFQTGVVISF